MPQRLTLEETIAELIQADSLVRIVELLAANMENAASVYDGNGLKRTAHVRRIAARHLQSCATELGKLRKDSSDRTL